MSDAVSCCVEFVWPLIYLRLFSWTLLKSFSLPLTRQQSLPGQLACVRAERRPQIGYIETITCQTAAAVRPLYHIASTRRGRTREACWLVVGLLIVSDSGLLAPAFIAYNSYSQTVRNLSVACRVIAHGFRFWSGIVCIHRHTFTRLTCWQLSQACGVVWAVHQA